MDTFKQISTGRKSERYVNDILTVSRSINSVSNEVKSTFSCKITD